jgi:hypothetical protein
MFLKIFDFGNFHPDKKSLLIKIKKIKIIIKIKISLNIFTRKPFGKVYDLNFSSLCKSFFIHLDRVRERVSHKSFSN